MSTLKPDQVLAVAAALLVVIVFAFRGQDGPRREGSASPGLPTAATQKGAGQVPAAAEGSDFDFYVLVLSWSPTHCSSDRGRGEDDDAQCRSGRPYGFVLHGLWPQYERGYPLNCVSDEPREVDPAIIGRMMEISPSEELIQHEWEKHGTCSGLSQRGYFAMAKQAFESLDIPDLYERLERAARTTPGRVRDDFVAANPKLKAEAVSATCRRGELAEIWICFDKSLEPRACSNEVRRRHCGERDVRMQAVRGDWPR